jgi:phage-related minor tail protein
MANSFGDAFMSVIDGTSSVKDAFRSMARSIIAELYQIFVVKKITGFISGALQTAFTGGLAPATSPVPTPAPRASGGMMSPNTPYLVGERGPELVMPNRQSTVMNADLTQKALSGGGETIVVNQTINVSTGVQQTVRNEIQSLMPQISEAAKSAVVDAKRRGGSYGRAFG